LEKTFSRPQILEPNLKSRMFLLSVGVRSSSRGLSEPRERNNVRVLYNGVMRNVLGPDGEEVTGDWRKLHKEGLHYLFSSPNIIGVTKLNK